MLFASGGGVENDMVKRWRLPELIFRMSRTLALTATKSKPLFIVYSLVLIVDPEIWTGA
jgi:hypothetical protein